MPALVTSPHHPAPLASHSDGQHKAGVLARAEASSPRLLMPGMPRPACGLLSFCREPTATGMRVLCLFSQEREELFFRALCLCHTIQVKDEEEADGPRKAPASGRPCVYISSSPDELALVEGVQR